MEHFLRDRDGIKRHRRTPFWKKVITTLLVLLVMFVGLPSAYVLHLGGVAQILEDRISAVSGAAQVTVGGASFAFRSGPMPVYIHATNIGMQLDDTDLLIPKADIAFGLNSLVTGAPSEVAISGLEVDIIRSANGWTTSPLAMFLFESIKKLSTTSGSNTSGGALAPKGFERLTVRASRVSLSHQDPGIAPLVLGDATISVTSDATTGIGGFLTLSRQIDKEAGGRLKADFVGWPSGGNFLVDITANDFVTAGLVPYFDRLPAAVDGFGTISGALSAGVDASQITRMDMAISAIDGTIQMPGSNPEAGFRSIWLDASYRREADLVSIGTMQINLDDDRHFSFSGDLLDFHSDQPVVAGALGINRLSLASLNQEWPDTAAADVKKVLFDHFSGGALTDISFDFVGRYNKEDGNFAMSRMTLDSSFTGIRLDLAAGQYQRIVGTAEGTVNLSLGTGGQVQSMGLELGLGDGSVLIAGYDGAVGIDAIEVKAGLSDNRLTLERFDVALANGAEMQFGGNLSLVNDWTPQTLSLSMASKQMQFDLFHALWPQWLKPATRQLVADRIPAGLVQDATINLVAALDGTQPQIETLTGSLAMANAEMTLLGAAPPMTNVYGKLSLKEEVATIVLNQANIADLALLYGRVTIASPLVGPLAGTVPKAEAKMAFKGSLATAIAVGGEFGLGKIGVFEVAAMQPQGEVELSLNAAFPIQQRIDREAISLAIDATISDGSFQNLPYGTTIEDANLVANFAKGVIEISGKAAIAGIAGDFSFRSDALTDNVSFIGKAAPSATMAEMLADITGFDVGGQVGGSVTMSGDMALTEVSVDLAAQMRSASVNVPEISWAKLPSENGHARLTFLLRNGRVNRLQDVNISLGSLSVLGQVALGPGGSVQGALLERIKWPGNDLRDVIIENSGEGVNVSATARIVDLVPLRRNSGIGANRKISFDLTANQFVIGDGLTLAGHLVGSKHQAGGGKAVLNGDLMFQGKPLIEEANLTVIYSDTGEFLRGTGLVGGAETTLKFTNGQDTPPRLEMASQNAGRMLTGLNVTDTIRSGSIELVNTYVPDNFAEFDTQIKIREFNVVEAPRAVRAFSVLGPIGLLSLVKGDGTRFEWGEAEFRKRGSLVDIRQLRGGGVDIALSMVGRYDTMSREVEVSGNLVPANLLNQVIGAIPLLGNILTGVDKGGLFVTQFSMSGLIDDPQTSTNAASLIPGILRDVVSPDWLKREGTRILGIDNAPEG